MKNITGPPVEGENFFGREHEFKYVWKRIEDGNNVIFPSPRRVGKTSFALKLIAKAKEEGWNTININLEKVSTEHDFIEILIDQLKVQSWWEIVKGKGNELIDAFKKLKPSFEYGGAKVELEWNTNKKSIYKDLADLLNHENKTLIFLDELTVLLTSIVENGENGKKDVKGFLHWLRDLRITAGSKIRWIFCSSVGIENFTHKYGISHTVNDIEQYNLKPYDKVQSEAMLMELGNTNELVLPKEIIEDIVEKLDYCLPYFLQLIFKKVHYLVKLESRELKIPVVSEAYNMLVEEDEFNTWIERIDEQYGDIRDMAFVVLRHICQEREGTKRESLVNVINAKVHDDEKAELIVVSLLYMLKNDGYLIEKDRLYIYRSPLLRDFWFNRFVK